jgi:hypothetical protein
MDPLKRYVDSLDGVDAAFHDMYTVQKDGKFKLTAIEMADDFDIVKTVRAENAAHRTANVALKQQLSAFGDLKPDEVRVALTELEATKTELEAVGTKDKVKIDAAVEARLKVATAPLQEQIKTLSSERDTLKTANEGFAREGTTRTIHEAMREACVALKCAPTTYTGEDPDALVWAERNAQIVDGKVIDKKSGLPLQQALRGMFDDGLKTHWLGESVGGDAKGNNGKGGPSGANPWAAKTWNIGKQGEIQSKDPKRAEALAKAAGVGVDDPYHPDNGIPEVNVFS